MSSFYKIKGGNLKWGCPHKELMKETNSVTIYYISVILLNN